MSLSDMPCQAERGWFARMWGECPHRPIWAEAVYSGARLLYFRPLCQQHFFGAFMRDFTLMHRVRKWADVVTEAVAEEAVKS